MKINSVLSAQLNPIRYNKIKQNTNIISKDNRMSDSKINTAETVPFGIGGIGVLILVLLGGLAIEIGTLALLIANGDGTYGTGSYDYSREIEEEEVQEELNGDLEEISGSLSVSKEQAGKIVGEFLSTGMIKPSKNGQEKGINAIMGYGVEKYKIAMDFITPIVLAQLSKTSRLKKQVPNGMLLYGPPGSGKTYIADKVCEHLGEFGVSVIDVELNQNDHEGNVNTIINAFKDAEKHHKETNGYTIINFKNDIDNYFIDRTLDRSCHQEVSALMSCAEECASKGAIWVATANNPKEIDKAILRSGRLDIKIPVGNMKDFAIADMLKYSLIKYGEAKSTESFEYERVVEHVKQNKIPFTPSEYEKDFVKKAINKKPEGSLVTADAVIREIDDYTHLELYTLDERMQKKFSEDQEYVGSSDEGSDDTQDA